jgi:hypothetical protein
MAERVVVNETGLRPTAFLLLLAAPGVAAFPDFCPFAAFFRLGAVLAIFFAEAAGRDVDFFFEDALLGTDLAFFDTFTLFEVFARLGAADLWEDTAFFFSTVTPPLRALFEDFANLDDGDRRLLKLLRRQAAARRSPPGCQVIADSGKREQPRNPVVLPAGYRSGSGILRFSCALRIGLESDRKPDPAITQDGA